MFDGLIRWLNTNKYVRIIKMIVFFFLGLFTSYSMLNEAVSTFGKAPSFSPSQPDDRCISWFDSASSFAQENKNTTIVAFAVNAGRYRIGFCTDLTNDELDAKFDKTLLFDPLLDATNGDCSLTNASLAVQRETQCTVVPETLGATVPSCRQVLATNPRPYGAGWQYQISSSNNNVSSSESLCAADYALNNDMPPCPYSNVRFYGKENKAVSLVFIIASCLSILAWCYEAFRIYQFSSCLGESYGDLSCLVLPMDGTWGGIYICHRVFFSGEPMPGREPFMTWPQFAGGCVKELFGLGVGLVGILGCRINKGTIKMLLLFLISLCKLIHSTVTKALSLHKKEAADAEDILMDADAVPDPPSVDANLNALLSECVRRANDKPYMTDLQSQISNKKIALLENSPSKRVYTKCISKFVQANSSGCIASEIERLTTICQRETTDPAIYNECITWLQLLEQCESFAAGGPGTYGPPRFPDWRTKAAPQLASARLAAEQAIAERKKKKDECHEGEAPLLDRIFHKGGDDNSNNGSPSAISSGTTSPMN